MFRRALIASSLMILAAVYLQLMTHAENVKILQPLSTFPTRIGEWSGRVDRFDQKVYDVLGVTDSFLADYAAPDGRQVQLYAGFYQSQREGELIHSPKNCMPGGGWNILHTSLEEIHAPNPGKIKVIKMVLQKGKERLIMLYWFQSRGRFIHSEYMDKVYLVWDAMTKNRTDGSFIRLISPIQKDETHTVDYMKQFAETLIPILEEYLPGA